MTLGEILNSNGQQLKNHLISKKISDSDVAKPVDDDKFINVAGVGSIVSATYEQLRNAAEYAQEHLLMQKAIRRFFVRNLSFQTETTAKKVIAEELISELTQSGYIPNGTQPVSVVNNLFGVIKKNYVNYWRLKKSDTKNTNAQDWALDLLSAESEKLIITDRLQCAYVDFVYRHYQKTLQKDVFVNDKTDDANYEVSLYISIYRSLLKSDIATVRFDMQQLYGVKDTNIEDYREFHKKIDTIFYSDLTVKITRYINKYGAPLRIFRSFIGDNENISDLLSNRGLFDSSFNDQIESEYRKSKSKLNSGLLKSIAFLLITKTIIGLAVEIPYDIASTGVIMILPLVINLLSPVVYMALLRVGIHLPNKANTKAVMSYMDNALFGDNDGSYLISSKIKSKKYPIGFKIAYIATSLLMFGLVINLLLRLDFNIVQIGIFFMFFASASFLGFRLSRIVQELELVTERPSMLTAIRDFFFLPFTILGKWLSEKYQKVNFVAIILDTIIELPLKTVLRLIRQWGGFIDSKKDDI